jgi:hypothetical protein
MDQNDAQLTLVRLSIECKDSSLWSWTHAATLACMTHAFTDQLISQQPEATYCCIFFGPKQTDCILFSEGIGLKVREIIRLLLLLSSGLLGSGCCVRCSVVKPTARVISLNLICLPLSLSVQYVPRTYT